LPECPLLALSGHGPVHRTCLLLTQSGHSGLSKTGSALTELCPSAQVERVNFPANSEPLTKGNDSNIARRAARLSEIELTLGLEVRPAID